LYEIRRIFGSVRAVSIPYRQSFCAASTLDPQAQCGLQSHSSGTKYVLVATYQLLPTSACPFVCARTQRFSSFWSNEALWCFY